MRGSYARQAGRVVGAAVAAELLVAQTRDTACLVRYIAATPAGIAFVLVLQLREPLPATPERSSTERLLEAYEPLLLHNPRSGDQSAIRFHVEFSDGRTFQRPKLWHLGSSSDDERAEFKCWLEGLPPEGGSVSFVLDWEGRGITNARAEFPSEPLLSAARRAIPLFPDGQG